MSGEQILCETCGYNSTNRERCTNCGQDISDQLDNPPFLIPMFGRLTLRLHGEARAEQAWRELADIWRDKVEKFTPHKDSQLERFDTSADTVELYGADYMADIMREALGARGTLDFQELPHEQMPQRAPYKPLRPPTVPRRKR